ncbi:MAG: hypothetical protein Q8P15_01265 [Nanoarchaeota archaeon]|nr:hypothetical protein [Nanoarchaeota archaeon]
MNKIKRRDFFKTILFGFGSLSLIGKDSLDNILPNSVVKPERPKLNVCYSAPVKAFENPFNEIALFGDDKEQAEKFALSPCGKGIVYYSGAIDGEGIEGSYRVSREIF